MIWKGKDLKDYSEIINVALKLKGDEQKEFVQKYSETGKYAISNIGYIAGYYDSKTASKIIKIFKTQHPIFPNLGK